MGRGKIEIKRIENASNRQVTYSKRRNGILKKAKEITVLCDAKVSLIIYASSGKMHDYCSPSTSLVDILEQYHRQSGRRLWDPKHENLSNEIERIKRENDRMQIKLRHLNGEDISSLNPKELIALEDALENGLVSIRDKQSEKMERMRKNRQQEIARQQQELAMENSVSAEIDNYQRENHHDYAYHVQPIQPNLQERI
ncbi:Floral homeotic protein PISTILLATA [Citrus sinensis]|uniref:Floral homeotic protein PISTILLATA n=1 Tax=Citrus sinensis TaxID=2711 RepID=A0ACB8KRX1_CITSI|nr:Floral homeotic protein PISTILLATA [Citrus sinensis]